MLSLTCKIAIKAVIYLSCKSALGEKASIREVANEINGSEHTVGKILQTLARQEIINSTKGPNGGFFIDDEQQNQPVSIIIESIEGKQIFHACGLGLSKCSETHPCPIHHEYKVARELIENIFRNKRIKDLCDPVSNGIAYLIG